MNVRQMARPFRLLAPVLLVASLVTAGCGSLAPHEVSPDDQPITETEILWDRHGVPHVFAVDSTQLFYAYGWAQMQGHAELILRLYGEARGRAAEYWGEEHLEQDEWLRTVGVPTRAQEWYEAQDPLFKGFLDAFAEGMNDFCEQHPERISEDIKQVLPVQPTDGLALAHRVIHFEFVTSRRVTEALEKGLSQERTAGSNAWAVGPSRSASGNAMLLANPHLPWSSFFLWFEAHLVSPDVNFYGAGLVGQPILAIGFNRYLGWTHTVNTHDGADHYGLRLAGRGYRWEGRIQEFQRREETIRIKQPDGSLREKKLEILNSVHGPVVARKGNRAIALRVVGLYETDLIRQYWEMARATSLAEFEKAISRLQMPMFTLIYADRDGHILSLFGGLVPRRPAGPWNWNRLVPGDSARTLWTEYHSYEELPKVVDPPSGWVQNANEPPWTTTLPYQLDADQFPSYMAPRFMSFRAQRSARMLDEDPQMTFEELVAYKHSTRMELADRILDDLLPAARQFGGPQGNRAAAVLEAWDRQADPESRGAVLFDAFWGEFGQLMRGRNPFSEAWSEEHPRESPDGLSDPRLAARALTAAAVKVERTYGALDVPWGEVVRVRRGDIELPANGATGALGVFRVVFTNEGEDQLRHVVGGDSFVAAVEFGEPLRAEVLNSAGNSSDPNSPHFNDQLGFFSQKQLRPALLTRTDIEANLEAREKMPAKEARAAGN